MVKLKLKLKKVGNSYGLMVPKSLIDTGVINKNIDEFAVEIITENEKVQQLEEELYLLKQRLNNQENINPPTGI